MPDLHLDRPGARLAYSVEGDGPPVIALHGMLSSRRSTAAAGFYDWHEVAAAGRSLIRYDARGHGASTGRPEPEDWRWDRLADDLLALLDRVAPGTAVDAIGVSMGVGTILTAAVREPDRFRRFAFAIPPTVWATRVAQGAQYVAMADAVEQQGLPRVLAVLDAQPPLPILDAAGLTVPLPDVPESLLPSLMRGAGASDLPSEGAIASLPQRTLLRPWVGDAGHPLSTAERLHELLVDSALEVTETPEDLAAVGPRFAAFLGD